MLLVGVGGRMSIDFVIFVLFVVDSFIHSGVGPARERGTPDFDECATIHAVQ